MEGIKETKEAIVGMLELGFYIGQLAKDGLQVSDMMELFAKLQNDHEFMMKLKVAYEGGEKIPAEIKDITIAESFELAMTVMPVIIAKLGK